GPWKAHLIWHSACNETPSFLDITGDGKPELLLGSQPESQLGFIPIPSPEKATEKWTFYPVGQTGDPMKNGTFKYYHGLGAGDFNRDGRVDVLIPHGWYEAPEDRTSGPWEFHPLPLSKEENGNPLSAANLFAEDLDLDGDSDIMMSSAHQHGVWWFENIDGKKMKYHLIDETVSQTHALEYIDINGDGEKDLVTGKRFFAHNGGDPGAYDPVKMLWYEVHRTKGEAPKFIRHEIPEGYASGVGTQFQVTDFNNDKRPDIVLSNKKGVNLILQVAPK
ncbi:MAG: FG-GAP repeat domain-containing protein, partial [Planctomycetaceae bacterium]